jgi:hypothetical protein
MGKIISERLAGPDDTLYREPPRGHTPHWNRAAAGAVIRVTYASIDGVRETRRYKTLKGAQKFAHYLIGAHPELGSFYAVSGDGVGRITCAGCTLRELFPAQADMTPAEEILQ